MRAHREVIAGIVGAAALIIYPLIAGYSRARSLSGSWRAACKRLSFLQDEFHDKSRPTASVGGYRPLILVDEADRGVGHLSKVLCHEGRGVLHRAFHG